MTTGVYADRFSNDSANRSSSAREARSRRFVVAVMTARTAVATPLPSAPDASMSDANAARIDAGSDNVESQVLALAARSERISGVRPRCACASWASRAAR